MAADAELRVHLTCGAVSRVDDLCPHCLLPSLWLTNLYVFTDTTGPDRIGELLYCDGCGVLFGEVPA